MQCKSSHSCHKGWFTQRFGSMYLIHKGLMTMVVLRSVVLGACWMARELFWCPPSSAKSFFLPTMHLPTYQPSFKWVKQVITFLYGIKMEVSFRSVELGACWMAQEMSPVVLWCPASSAAWNCAWSPLFSVGFGCKTPLPSLSVLASQWCLYLDQGTAKWHVQSRWGFRYSLPETWSGCALLESR